MLWHKEISSYECCIKTHLIHTYTGDYMIEHLLERLAEMFPKQDYQSKLDRYIASKYPTDTGDIERLLIQYDRNQSFKGGW